MAILRWLLRATVLAGAAGCVGGGGALPARDDSGAPASPSNASGALPACNPLVEQAKPTRLEEVIAAGRSKDGTIYVVDRGLVSTYVGLRLFIGASGTALRQGIVAGSGEGPEGIVLSAGKTGDLQVRVELTNGAASLLAIFVGPPDTKSKSFDPATQGETLALLSPAEVSSLAVETPPATCDPSAPLPVVASRACDPLAMEETSIAWAATTPDAHQLYVFSSRKTNAPAVFYGSANTLRERRVIELNADSSWHLTFDLDGVATLAQLSGPMSFMGWGPPRLQPATESYGSRESSIPLTAVPGAPNDFDDPAPGSPRDGGVPARSRPLKSDAELVAGLSFLCF